MMPHADDIIRITMLVRLAMVSNAKSPMVVMFVPIVMLVMVVLNANALVPIVVTGSNTPYQERCWE